MGASSGRVKSKPRKIHLTFFTVILASDWNWQLSEFHFISYNREIRVAKQRLEAIPLIQVSSCYQDTFYAFSQFAYCSFKPKENRIDNPSLSLKQLQSSQLALNRKGKEQIYSVSARMAHKSSTGMWYLVGSLTHNASCCRGRKNLLSEVIAIPFQKGHKKLNCKCQSQLQPTKGECQYGCLGTQEMHHTSLKQSSIFILFQTISQEEEEGGSLYVSQQV